MRYLVAVSVVHSAAVVPEPELVRIHSLAAIGIDEEMDYVPHWTTRKIYVCPRGIIGHKGNPGCCGNKCRNAAKILGSGGIVDEEGLQILTVRKQILFNYDLCVEGR
jgi:hypothetical protein